LAQGQGLDLQGQSQGLKICPRGQLKAKDQGQGQQHCKKLLITYVNIFQPGFRETKKFRQWYQRVPPMLVDTDFSSLARFKAVLKRIDLSKFLTYCID